MSTPLLRARERARLTQVELAEAAELSQTHYSRVEAGAKCSPEVAERIVRELRRSGVTDISELHVLYPHRFAARRRRP